MQGISSKQTTKKLFAEQFISFSLFRAGQLLEILGWKICDHQRNIRKTTMVFKWLQVLVPYYLASKFSGRNTSYNLRVLVIAAPSSRIAFLMRLGGRNHSGRSNAKSAKLCKARLSRKAAFQYSVVFSYS